MVVSRLLIKVDYVSKDSLYCVVMETLLDHPYKEETCVIPMSQKLVLYKNMYFDNLVVEGELHTNGHKMFYNNISCSGNIVHLVAGQPQKELPKEAEDDEEEEAEVKAVMADIGYTTQLLSLKTLPEAAQVLARRSLVAKQGTDKWKKVREGFITASDAAKVLGECQYGTPESLFAEKTYSKKGFTGSTITRMGQEREPMAAAEYSKRTGRTLISLDIIPHPTIKCIAASPDRIALPLPSDNGKLINVEIKCPGKRSIDTIPHHYIPQLMLQMEVFDIDVTHFVQFKPPQRGQPMQYTCIEIHRNRDWFIEREKVFNDFWARVLAKRAENPLVTCYTEPKWNAKSNNKRVVDVIISEDRVSINMVYLKKYKSCAS